MIGMVLVTHGRLAAEFITAMEHVVGPQEAIEAVCIGPDDDMEARRADITEAIGRVAGGKGVIILTDLFGGTRHHRLGIEHDSRRVAVALGRQVHHQHARAVGRVPPVLRVLAAEAAPEDRVVEPELPPDLRHLADVAKEIRQVADRHRRAELARDPVAAQERLRKEHSAVPSSPKTTMLAVPSLSRTSRWTTSVSASVVT